MREQTHKNNLPKICLISAVPGTIFFYRELIVHLKSVGAQVGVAASDMPRLYELKNHLGCKIFPVEISRRITPLRDLVSIVKLSYYFRREKYDIVHAHTPKGGFIGMMSAFLGGISHRVYTVHGLLLGTATGLKRKSFWVAELLSCKLATEVLAVSPSLRKCVVEEKLCPAEKIKVLCDGTACGINLRKFEPSEKTTQFGKQTREKLNIPEDAIVIGFVGRITPDKGIETLVDGFLKLQQQTANVYLLLIGRIETIRESLNQQTMDTINSNDNIHCTGHVKNTVPFYAAMDLVVLPSRREGFGLSLAEAGAMGLPTIATRVTGCVDAVVDNVTGLMVDVNDELQLAEAMLKLARNTGLRNKLGRQGRERVKKLFDSKRLVAEHMALYKRILSKKQDC
ncbi:MAG: glycosyltransferase family 4 protein [Sedimentisphaerales bacterium]|nr:glycosyltransferase family 4 protein [Sedimentisphaerales bacterium]